MKKILQLMKFIKNKIVHMINFIFYVNIDEEEDDYDDDLIDLMIYDEAADLDLFDFDLF